MTVAIATAITIHEQLIIYVDLYNKFICLTTMTVAIATPEHARTKQQLFIK